MDPDETEIGYASTINIDEEPAYEDSMDGDPLHPERNVPSVPASDDSGTMF